MSRLAGILYRRCTLIYFCFDKQAYKEPETSFICLHSVVDFDILRDSKNIPYSKEVSTVYQELEKGSHVILILDKVGSHIIHFSCICFGRSWTSEIEAWVRIPEGYAYIYNCNTTENARGRKLFQYAISWCLHEYNGRCLIGSVHDNKPSIRAIHQVGGQHIGYITKDEFLSRFTWIRNTTGLEVESELTD